MFLDIDENTNNIIIYYNKIKKQDRCELKEVYLKLDFIFKR